MHPPGCSLAIARGRCRRTSHGGCFAIDLTIVGLMRGRKQATVQIHERT